VGAVGVQLAALAFPLRPARGGGLGAVPRFAGPVQPQLGAERLGPDLFSLGHPALHRQGHRGAGGLAHAQLRRRSGLGLLCSAGDPDGLSGAWDVGGGFRAGASGIGRAGAVSDRGRGRGRAHRRSGNIAGEASGAGISERAKAGGGIRFSWRVAGQLTSPQLRLGPRRVKGSAPFAHRDASLRWHDGLCGARFWSTFPP
jgi:hypothetical protein